MRHGEPETFRDVGLQNVAESWRLRDRRLKRVCERALWGFIMELELKGQQGKSVKIVGNSVVIRKSGLLSATREKSLPIPTITSIEVKKPGLMQGYIQFSDSGRTRDSSRTLGGGVFDAANDENSVLFQGEDAYKTALEIK